MSEESNEVKEVEPYQKISVGLSPFGGVGIQITSPDGTQAGASFSIDEIEKLTGRLQSLGTILLHQEFMQAAQQAAEAQQVAQKLGVNKKVWTPNG